MSQRRMTGFTSPISSEVKKPICKDFNKKCLIENKNVESKIAKRKLTGYVSHEDLQGLYRIRQKILGDLGPMGKPGYSFIGESGADDGLKYFNAR